MDNNAQLCVTNSFVHVASSKKRKSSNTLASQQTLDAFYNTPRGEALSNAPTSKSDSPLTKRTKQSTTTELEIMSQRSDSGHSPANVKLGFVTPVTTPSNGNASNSKLLSGNLRTKAAPKKLIIRNFKGME
jgi:hypothetical protein